MPTILFTQHHKFINDPFNGNRAVICFDHDKFNPNVCGRPTPDWAVRESDGFEWSYRPFRTTGGYCGQCWCRGHLKDLCAEATTQTASNNDR